MTDLENDWYVYRYNLSRHVLKAPETLLEVQMAGSEGSLPYDYMASFQMSGLDEPVRAEMIFDPRTESWFGESDRFDFRWERVENSNTVMLVGHASDRSNVTHRDFFVAVRSRREVQLPWPPPNERRTYQFGPCYCGSLERKLRVQAGGGITVSVAEDPPPHGPFGEVTFDNTRYIVKKDFVPHEKGWKVVGWRDEGGEEAWIWLWLLPLDELGGRLLATGYDYTPVRYDSIPGTPPCTGTRFGGG